MATSYEEIAELIEHRVPVVIATALRPDAFLGRRAVLARGELLGSFDDAGLDGALRERASALLRAGSSKTLAVKAADGQEVELFLDVYPSPPALFIFGGVHVGIPLTRFGKMLGFRVHVIDPRGVFATRERFAEADELAIEHPDDYLDHTTLDESSYVVVLTHDPKHDEPIIKRVVDLPVAYIGAIGSRKTNAERNQRLLAQGVSQEKLDRVHAPIGLDIGSQEPGEMALAIIAEVVAARHGKSGRSLRELAAAAR